MANDNQTEEKKPNLNYDWYLLGCADIAKQYLKQGEEGIPLAQKSLELMLKDAKIFDPWIVNTVTDPKVIPKTIENQLQTYNQFRADQTVEDLIGRYDEDISRYLGENAGNVANDLGEFMGEKYNDIVKKVGEAKYILDGKKKFNRGSDEEVEEAEKTMEKYQKVIATIQMLEGQRLSKFRMRVEEEVVKENFQELYKKEDKKDKK